MTALRPFEGPVRIACLLIGVCLFSASSRAQVPCDFGSAALTLESGNAVAAVANDGHLFRAIGTTLPNFEVPIGSGINVIFQAKPWIGGLMDGEFHFTGSPSQRLYYPGPLDQSGYGVPNCGEFNRIWKVTRSDLNELEYSGTLTQDIIDWPWNLGAPTEYGSGEMAHYNPTSGDLPAIVGRESAWWIMNDGGRAELPDLWFPQVGLEARVLAAAMPSHPEVEVYYFRYTFTYKNTSPLEDAYIAFYMDPDLGNFNTDSFGSDSLLSTVYVYKKENYDDKYGDNPPALGVTLLRGPLVNDDGKDNDRDGLVDEIDERLSLTAFIGGDDVHDGRTNLFYNHLKGLCGYTGTPIREGEGCFNATGQATSFWYSGDPVAGTGWLDDRQPYDKAFLISSGPFDWLPGEEQMFEFAIIWARGTDHLDSITRVRTIADFLRKTPEYFGVNVLSVEERDAPPLGDDELGSFYPNPARDDARFEYTVANPANVTITLFDITGKEIVTVLDAFRHSGRYTESIDLSPLPSGVYFYRISIGRLRATKPIAVVR